LLKKIRVTRHQLPIQPAFTVTGHSLQGKTLPDVIVNLHEGRFAGYVAASQARTHHGLCLTQPVSLQQLNKCIPLDLLLEVSQFDALEHNTLVSYGYHEGPHVCVPDGENENGVAQYVPSACFQEESEAQSRRKKHTHNCASDEECAIGQPVVKCPCAASNNQPKTRMNSTFTTKVSVKC
jgi:hypothetical protein